MALGNVRRSQEPSSGSSRKELPSVGGVCVNKAWRQLSTIQSSEPSRINFQRGFKFRCASFDRPSSSRQSAELFANWDKRTGRNQDVCLDVFAHPPFGADICNRFDFLAFACCHPGRSGLHLHIEMVLKIIELCVLGRLA